MESDVLDMNSMTEPEDHALDPKFEKMTSH